jgi:hypothetical protein
MRSHQLLFNFFFVQRNRRRYRRFFGITNIFASGAWIFWQLELSAVIAVTGVVINWVCPYSWILSSGFLGRMPLNPPPSLLLFQSFLAIFAAAVT